MTTYAKLAPACVTDHGYAIAVLRDEVRRLARTGDRLVKKGMEAEAAPFFDRHTRLLRYVSAMERSPASP